MLAKVDGTGDKTLYFQHFFALAINLSLENACLIAIVVLACLLGAEVAGICILVNKLLHARRDRMQRELEETEEESERYGEETDAVAQDEPREAVGESLEETELYGEKPQLQGFAGAALLLGAVPMATQIVLLALAGATAVGALVFTLLIVILRAKGYALTAAGQPAEESVEETVEEVALSEDEPLEEERIPVAEPFDEIFVEIPAEEPVEEERAEEEAVAAEEETIEAPVEEIAETAAEEAPVALVAREEPVSAAQAAPNTIPVYSSAYPAGQIPVIEKHITETYREVIKETNTTTTTNNVGEKYSPATEEILKAIAELMKLGTQLRMEKVMEVENPVTRTDGESVPTFAEAEEDEHDADEPEVDDVDETDEADEADGEAEERDDDYESELFSGNERIVGFDEETGCYIVAHYRKSFEAKLIQARPEVKKYYSAIKNALLSYEGTKDRVSWTINSYTNDHTQIAKINVRNRTLDLYLALDPATLEDSAYHGRDVGDKKKYADTPFLFKVNSARKLTLALELVQRTCEEQGLSPIDIETVNYEELYPFEATEDLVRRGLIREYLREEKPAVTFELAPDHEPELPEEDESVIPANANFTWEFDDDQPAAEEPVVEESVEEPVVEEPVAEEPAMEEPVTEEPATEEAPVTSTTVTTSHETVKTTERHYTERYVGGIPTQQTEYQMQLKTVNDAPMIEGVAVEAVDEPADVMDEPEEVAETVAVAEEEALAVEDETEETYDEEIATVFADEETEAVYEDEESEAVYEDEETEAVYEEEETEAVYEDEETEAVYEDEEPEEVYEEEETEAVYEEEETEAVYEEEETEAVYEDEEPEEVYEEEETEAVYEDEEPEAVYEDEEPEAVYEDEESEEVYEDEESEAVYEDEEPEAVYEDEEPEAVYEDEEPEEEEAEAPVTPVVKPAPQSNPNIALLDVCCFDDHFENGAIVNLETLKQVGLVPETATVLKVYASGPIKGQFTVEANHFTLDAIKSISDADGDSIMIR